LSGAGFVVAISTCNLFFEIESVEEGTPCLKEPPEPSPVGSRSLAGAAAPARLWGR
jgi:hypothetical protein